MRVCSCAPLTSKGIDGSIQLIIHMFVFIHVWGLCFYVLADAVDLPMPWFGAHEKVKGTLTHTMMHTKRKVQPNSSVWNELETLFASCAQYVQHLLVQGLWDVELFAQVLFPKQPSLLTNFASNCFLVVAVDDVGHLDDETSLVCEQLDGFCVEVWDSIVRYKLLRDVKDLFSLMEEIDNWRKRCPYHVNKTVCISYPD